MSAALWEKLPSRFLRMKFGAFDKLDRDVKQLICELAAEQEFKCALCSRSEGLEVEHDHDPSEGSGDVYTIYNIRGLVCRRCNWHLMVYEREESGDYLNWENVSSNLSSHEYEDYIYRYDCRTSPLIDAAHVRRVGCRNPEHRKLVLWMLDQRYEEGRFPWQQRSEEAWNGKIESPEQFLQALLACMKFVVEQLKNDPTYQPPEQFLKVMAQMRPIFEEAKAMREQAMAEGSGNVALVEG